MVEVKSKVNHRLLFPPPSSRPLQNIAHILCCCPSSASFFTSSMIAYALQQLSPFPFPILNPQRCCLAACKRLCRRINFGPGSVASAPTPRHDICSLFCPKTLDLQSHRPRIPQIFFLHYFFRLLERAGFVKTSIIR